MSIAKQYILFFIVSAIFLGAYAKFGRADSIICDDFIFTETSSVEVKLIDRITGAVFKGTIPVESIRNVGSGGARIDLHTGSEIYFNQMTPCMDIEDEIDSVRNLRWFLERSADARVSNWKHRR